MVLYKRKSITLPEARPLPSNINRKIWYIKETGEWFLTYAEFLERLDFYMRHYFTCEITGASCLTFFEALNSEEEQFQYVEKMFPLKLREPVAKFIHFNEIRRLDMLVEQVYSNFKNNFFPGETVYLRKAKQEVASGDEDPEKQLRLQLQQMQQQPTSPQNSSQSNVYIIKEKAQFNAVIDRNTGQELVPAHTKYMLQEAYGSASIIADEDQIYRDRSTFTKHLIKCFCKITLRRASSKMGAPWCVKDEYLPIYNLSPEWPPHMLKYREDYVDMQYLQQQQQQQQQQQATDSNNRSGYTTADSADLKRELDAARTATPDHKRLKTEDSVMEYSPSVDHGNLESNNNVQNDHQTITEITEDLKIPFSAPRPASISNKLFSYSKEYVALPAASNDKSFSDSVGKLLHCYQFLMGFHTTLQLSKFSWDNFVNSMRFTDRRNLMDEFVDISLEDGTKNKVERFNAWNSLVYDYIDSLNSDKMRITVELDEDINEDYLDEIKITGASLTVECFCSLLRLFMDTDGNWTTLVTSEWLEGEDLDEELEEDKEDGVDEDSNGNDKDDGVNPNEDDSESGKNENKSANDDNDDDNDDESKLETALEKCLNYRKMEWTDRLAKRQFSNGHWLIILLGVLQDCMHLPMYTTTIKNFMKKLIPFENSTSNIALNKQLWRQFCKNISIKEKIDIMWILVEVLSNYSSIIRSAMDDSMELSNQIRSERFRLSRDLKACANTVSELKESIYLMSVENGGVNGNEKEEEKEEEGEKEKEKEKEKELAERQEKLRKANTELERLQKRKHFLDVKLIESDIQRLKPLGSDRYGNKIYWLEYSGVPRPDSFSTEKHILSNRLWIQGPVKEAALLYFNLSEDQYENWISISRTSGKAEATKQIFNVYRDDSGSYYHHDEQGDVMLINDEGVVNSYIELSPLQRKIIDETPENLLLSPNDWVFLQDTNELTNYMEWLDSWGKREHETLKQLEYVIEPLKENLLDYQKLVNQKLEQERNSIVAEINAINITEEEFSAGSSVANTTGTHIDDELEDIANQIMALDDASKTRKVLLQIQDLEAKRDKLLEKKKTAVETADSSEGSGSGSKISAVERKKILASREKKIGNLKDALDKLINLQRESERISITEWSNEMAIDVWSNELFKCNGNVKSAKDPPVITVSEKIAKILEQASIIEDQPSISSTESEEQTQTQDEHKTQDVTPHDQSDKSDVSRKNTQA